MLLLTAWDAGNFLRLQLQMACRRPGLMSAPTLQKDTSVASPDDGLNGACGEAQDKGVQVAGRVRRTEPVQLQHMAPIKGQLARLWACTSLRPALRPLQWL
jgi:hypothetical protein